MHTAQQNCATFTLALGLRETHSDAPFPLPPRFAVRALIFPGQGAQFVGMGRALYEASPIARSVFDQADAALGAPLSSLCFEGDPQVLLQTVNAQPALLTHAVAALEVARQRSDFSFDAAAGHSLGEWTAFVAAGAIAFEDAVRLVRLRGQVMQAAVPVGQGAMVALVGLDEDAVEDACVVGRAHGIVGPATFNGPEQVVISGGVRAVEAAANHAKTLGASRATRLAVSAPFHSVLMEPARAAVEEALAHTPIQAPKVLVCANVDASFPSTADEVRSRLSAQMVSPVRWAACIQSLATRGIERFTVLGAGTGLARTVQRLRLAPTEFLSDDKLLNG